MRHHGALTPAAPNCAQRRGGQLGGQAACSLRLTQAHAVPQPGGGLMRLLCEPTGAVQIDTWAPSLDPTQAARQCAHRGPSVATYFVWWLWRAWLLSSSCTCRHLWPRLWTTAVDRSGQNLGALAYVRQMQVPRNTRKIQVKAPVKTESNEYLSQNVDAEGAFTQGEQISVSSA